MKSRRETSRQQKTRNRFFLNGRRAALVVAGLVIGFGLALPQDSLAKNKHRHHVAAPPYWVRERVHVRNGHFAVPPRIAMRAEINRYRPYHSRRVYSASHRHYHQVYDFPVYYQERMVPRPYAYCNGHLYGGLHLSYNRPGLSVAVGW